MFCGVRRDQVCQVRNQSSPSSLLSLPTPLPHCVWLYVLIKSIYTIILYYCQPKQLLLLWPEILYVRNSPLEFLPSSLEHCFESSSNTRLVFVQIIWLDSIYFNQLRGSRIPRCMVTFPLKRKVKADTLVVIELNAVVDKISGCGLPVVQSPTFESDSQSTIIIRSEY